MEISEQNISERNIELLEIWLCMRLPLKFPDHLLTLSILIPSSKTPQTVIPGLLLLLQFLTTQ